jgi:Ca2+-binding RTX toxin-like protein
VTFEVDVGVSETGVFNVDFGITADSDLSGLTTSSTFTATATATATPTDSGEVTTLNNVALAVDTTDVDTIALRILNIELTANTNHKAQFLLLTFTQVDPNTGDPILVGGEPLTFSTTVSLFAEGQQGVLILTFDVGFIIDPTATFDFSFTYLGNDNPGSGADSINITDLFVEGVEIVPTSGNIKLGVGGSSNDIMMAQISPATDTTVTADEFDRTAGLVGTSGADILTATDAGQTLAGLASDDLLIGGAGADMLLGGTGSDILVGGAGADTLDGDDSLGVDTADYSSSPAFVIVNLSSTTQFSQPPGTATDGFGSTDTLIDIENVIGSDGGDDTLIGNGGSALAQNFLSGLGGNDLVIGSIGRDILSGGEGDDELCGGLGDDELFGGDGSDTLIGGPGSDLLRGGDDNDADFFVFKDADVGDGVDTIFDFKKSAGDALDLTDLFDGSPGPALSLADLESGGFITLSLVDGDNDGTVDDTLVTVDFDAGGIGFDPVDLVTVLNTTLDATDIAHVLV